MTRPVLLVLLGGAYAVALGHALLAPRPGSGGNPVLDLAACHTPEFHVEAWVTALKEDPKEIRRAAADAQKISDVLLARIRERGSEREPASVAAIRAAPRPLGIRRAPPLPVPERSFDLSR